MRITPAVACVLVCLGARSAFAQLPAPGRIDCNAEPGSLTAAEAMNTAIQCVGWLVKPEARAAPLIGTLRSAEIAARGAQLPGSVLNEFFSVVAHVAVERARRQGLSLVREKLEDGVCGLRIPAAGFLHAYHYTPPTLAPNTTYSWQVRATNSNGSTPGPVWRFTTGATLAAAGSSALAASTPLKAPSAPDAPYPADQATNVSLSSRLLWRARDAATSDLYFGSTTLDHIGRIDRTPMLPETCSLVRTTELTVLVGQGRALRAALTADLMALVRNELAVHMSGVPPLERSATGTVMLIARMATDPAQSLTRADVWLVLEPLINEPWDVMPQTDAGRRNLETVRVAMASTRAFLHARALAENPDWIDPAEVVRAVLTRHKLTDAFRDPARSAELREWTTVAIKAASAAGTDLQQQDLRQQLRSTVLLMFDTARKVGDDTTLLQWAQVIALAAVDGDAPRLLAALAETASQRVGQSCTSACAKARKVAALLAGIAAYALTYERLPGNASAAEIAALAQQQAEARRQALDAVIDAATDRRSRGGEWVWSLGTGVGSTFGRQRATNTAGGSPAAASNSDDDWDGFPSLHVPFGVALQRLPRPFGAHLMVTPLDLGHYVGKSVVPGTSPDWQSILALGAQAGVAIGKPGNFFVMGGSLTYSPRFATVKNGESSTRGALRVGIVLQYFVPLWDFN